MSAEDGVDVESLRSKSFSSSLGNSNSIPEDEEMNDIIGDVLDFWT